MISGVPALLMKIARLRPYVVCFVGKGIWEIFRKEISKLVNTVSPNSEAAAVAGSEPTSSSSTPKSSEIIAKEKDPEYENEAQLVGAAKKASIKKTTESKKSKRSVTQKLVFSWGIQPYKTVHSCRGILPYWLQRILLFIYSFVGTAVRETLFFVVPSTSGRVVSHQVGHSIFVLLNMTR